MQPERHRILLARVVAERQINVQISLLLQDGRQDAIVAAVVPCEIEDAPLELSIDAVQLEETTDGMRRCRRTDRNQETDHQPAAPAGDALPGAAGWRSVGTALHDGASPARWGRTFFSFDRSQRDKAARMMRMSGNERETNRQ